MSTKIGSIGHSLGIFHNYTLGWETIIPIVESAAYDYAARIPNENKTVYIQAKTSTLKKGDSFIVNIRSSGNTAEARRFDPSKVDYLDVTCIHTDKKTSSLYRIPSEDVRAKVSLIINKEAYKEYLVGTWKSKHIMNLTNTK